MPTMPPVRSSRQVGEALILPLLRLHGGNNLSYLNHIIIAHYNASYRCGKCLKQAFVSSLALHNHKKVCLGLTSKKSAGASDGKPSSGRGNRGHGGSSKATQKRMARLPLPILRAQAPFCLSAITMLQRVGDLPLPQVPQEGLGREEKEGE